MQARGLMCHAWQQGMSRPRALLAVWLAVLGSVGRAPALGCMGFNAAIHVR